MTPNGQFSYLNTLIKMHLNMKQVGMIACKQSPRLLQPTANIRRACFCKFEFVDSGKLQPASDPTVLY
jgi:hypothetical protein